MEDFFWERLADIVLGQASCSTRTANFGGISASSFSGTVRAGAEVNQKLFVTDGSNNRILIFNNTIVTPSINLTTPVVSLGGGRYRFSGSVFMNNNANTYGLQTLSADLNATGYGSISFSGGRSDTGGNSTYDFTYDFDPTVGGGNINNNLTLKLLASTWNSDTNTLFYFLPFTFNSFNVSSTKSQSFSFTVNKDQLSRIKDNIDHFEVWYTKNNTSFSNPVTQKWTQYVSNIPTSQIDTNGVVIAPKTTNLTSFVGSYIFKIVAINNWTNRQDSNPLYTAGTAPLTLLSSYPSFLTSASLIPTPTPNLDNNLTTVPTFSPIPTEVPVSQNIPDISMYENILKIIIPLIILFLLILLFMILRKRRKEKNLLNLN